MLSKTATIKNEYGIHCRPSTMITQEAQKYDAHIEVILNNNKAVLGSILELLALGARCGDVIKISVEGENEEAILNTFVELFETNFNFNKK